MTTDTPYERCLAFINCQLNPADRARDTRVKPAVTLSRMSGSGGHLVASQLAAYLQTKAAGEAPWTVFDRQLVERVLEENHLSKRVAEFMPEKHQPLITDVFEELLGLHPSSWTLVHQVSETILRLARLGYAILLGRGACLITRNLPGVFHVRLVGSLERRAARLGQARGLDHAAALALMAREDRGRREYLKEHFREDIDNPLLYHLVINTDFVSPEDAARMIGNEVVHRFHLHPHHRQNS